MATFKPFVIWNVSEGEDYKLVLESKDICGLEEKLGGQNLMSAIGNNATGMPPLRTMLMVTHASMSRFNHNIKMTDVYEIYDRYIQNGGSQVDFYTDIYVKIFQASGFFPQEQAEEIGEKLDELKEN